MQVFLHKLDHYTTLEAQGLAGAERRFRMSDLALRPDLDVFQAVRVQAGFRDGLEGFMFCASVGRFGGGASVEASRAHARGEDVMIAEHEAVVASRFDALHGRFKRVLDADDPRLRGVVDSLWPLSGRRILDLGCGKGRFARALCAQGASVVGLDLSAAMLGEATGIDRVRASARRLPFGPASFDGVLAVEVFEHLATPIA